MSRAAAHSARAMVVIMLALISCIHAFAHAAAQDTAQGPCRAYKEPPRSIPFLVFLHRPPTPVDDVPQPDKEYHVRSRKLVSTLGERSQWLLIDMSDGSSNGNRRWVYAGPATDPSALPTKWVCKDDGEEREP